MIQANHCYWNHPAFPSHGGYPQIIQSWLRKMETYGELCNGIPSGNLTYRKWPIEIVDLPITHGDVPVRYVNIYQIYQRITWL